MGNSNLSKVGLCLLLVVLLLSVAPAGAQQSSGVISGVVMDSQGAVVPGATITLINQAQGATFRQLESSAEGTFVITPVPPGTYTVIWRVLSVDTHRTQGDFTFRVGP